MSLVDKDTEDDNVPPRSVVPEAFAMRCLIKKFPLSVEDIFPAVIRIAPPDYCEATLHHIGVNFVGEPTAVMLRRRAFDDFGNFNPDLIMIYKSEQQFLDTTS